ncbi:MAG: hypothetical protein WCT04_26805 [Planctomycetota bacterium]
MQKETNNVALVGIPLNTELMAGIPESIKSGSTQSDKRRMELSDGIQYLGKCKPLPEAIGSQLEEWTQLGLTPYIYGGGQYGFFRDGEHCPRIEDGWTVDIYVNRADRGYSVRVNADGTWGDVTWFRIDAAEQRTVYDPKTLLNGETPINFLQRELIGSEEIAEPSSKSDCTNEKKASGDLCVAETFAMTLPSLPQIFDGYDCWEEEPEVVHPRELEVTFTEPDDAQPQVFEVQDFDEELEKLDCSVEDVTLTELDDALSPIA